ncbi:MAG: FtsX-like permease family protein [Clostridium sp.]|uniref:FtsX-like permease family protein n=1 Tax=Clostridium sp. TaxID=1506 RepID=UPI003F31BE8D
MRNTAWIIIDRFKKHPLFSIIAIIQFTIIFFLIYVGVGSFLEYGKTTTGLKKALGSSELYKISSVEDWMNNTSTKEDIKDYNEFYHYLKDNFNMLGFSNNNMLVKNIKLDNSVEVENGANIENMLTRLMVNEKYMKEFEIEVGEGRTFNTDEYEKNYDKEKVPIILGSDFKKITEIGAEFEVYIDEKWRNAEVIGFLKKGQEFVETPIGNYSMISYDNVAIVPEFLIEDNTFDRLGNIYLYKLISESYITDLSAEDKIKIKEKARELDLFQVQFTNITEAVESFKELFIELQFFNIAILLLTFLIGVGSLVLSIINSINDRKKEFGIYFALGATKGRIINIVIIEVLYITILAGIMSVPLIISRSVISGFSITGFIMMWIIIAIVNIAIIIIPIKKIKETPMSSLIREE